MISLKPWPVPPEEAGELLLFHVLRVLLAGSG